MVEIEEVENDNSVESDLTEVPKFPLNQVLDTPKEAVNEVGVAALEEANAPLTTNFDPSASKVVRPHFFAQPVDDLSEL